MSTPVTVKQMELARERAAKRQRQADLNGLAPLTQPWATRIPYRPRHIDFTADKVGGRQYTSFEGKRKEYEPRSAPKPLTPPQVEDVPLDVDTDDYKVDAENVICFNGRMHFLSNLYSASLVVDGHEYPTVEHYYQACKLYTLGNAALAAQIRHIQDAGQVKVYAKKLLRSVNILPDKVDEWKRKQGPILLHHAIVHKFVQNTDLREKLLETGEAVLAHTYDRDNLFATGCDKEKMLDWAKENNGQIIKIPTKIDNSTFVYIPLIGEGKNVLGFINMKVRAELHKFKATQTNTVDPIMLAAMQTLQLNGPSKGDAPTLAAASDGGGTNLTPK